MPKDRSDTPADQASHTNPSPEQKSAGRVGTEDRLPGNRTTPTSDDGPAPGGTEQPKDDRRKRGDLQKRGLL